MARVSSQQVLTASPFMSFGCSPKDAMSAPWFYACVCFASGLLASTLLAVVLPAYAEEDDVRSFVSFATGALMCCYFLQKLPVHKASKVEDKQIASHIAPKAYNATTARGNELASTCTPPPTVHPSVFSPSLSPPPGLGRSAAPPLRFKAPPGLGQQARPAVIKTPPQYEPQAFRKEIVAIMRDLSSHKNVSRAVGEVRQWNVPADRQAAEFADILTYALEEIRGNNRRSYIAFVGGLTGAFEKSECLAGLGVFFDNIFEDLCEEVAKLPKLIKTELLPVLNTVLSPEHVAVFVPEFVLAA